MRYGSNKPKSVGWMNDNVNKVREDLLRLVLSMIELGAYSTLGSFTTNNVDTVPTIEVLMKVLAEEIRGSQNEEERLKRMKTGLAGWGGGPSGSLEAVHNDFHVYLGGFVGDRNDFNEKRMKYVSMVGHMTSVPISAFDPIFWFHHW